MKNVKVLSDSETLLQVALPEGTIATWRDGKFLIKGSKGKVKDGIHPNGIPWGVLFSRDLPRPKFLSNNQRGAVLASTEDFPPGCTEFLPAMFEIATHPTMSLGKLPRFRNVFGKGNLNNAVKGQGTVNLMEEIDKHIDRFFTSGCNKVVVIYRQLPTYIPCDGKGFRIGFVVYVELAMMGC